MRTYAREITHTLTHTYVHHNANICTRDHTHTHTQIMWTYAREITLTQTYTHHVNICTRDHTHTYTNHVNICTRDHTHTNIHTSCEHMHARSHTHKHTHIMWTYARRCTPAGIVGFALAHGAHEDGVGAHLCSFTQSLSHCARGLECMLQNLGCDAWVCAYICVCVCAYRTVHKAGNSIPGSMKCMACGYAYIHMQANIFAYKHACIYL
jgi:hypothetical protein